MTRRSAPCADTPDPRVNVYALFEQRARADPTALAVLDGAGATTYGALAQQANAICSHLLQRGLAAEQPVGVLMQRRARLIAVLLGILKAGGAYVPFDPADPPQRTHRMLQSSGCDLVLGDRALLEALPSGTGTDRPLWRAVDVDSIPQPAADATPKQGCAPGGNRLAYLLFTSGSTGEPKAVEVEHAQVVALLRSAAALLEVGASDRFLAVSTIAFDASITELFLPLVTGTSLLLRDRTLLLDPQRLARDVHEHAITVVQTSPTVWGVVLDAVPDFPRLRVAITHSEAAGPLLARRLCARADAAWNLYGPTETTVWATGCRLQPDTESAWTPLSLPIGRPLPHVTAQVMDDQGHPVRDGTPGELWLGGAGVARGYRGQAALTAQRFVPLAGGRAYRSGDQVVRDAGGVLHFLGRDDDQMKVRGVRIESGEVEAALRLDPRVAHAAVTWFDTPGGSRAVVAGVVTRSGAACRPRDLNAGLAARLPGPMIPSRFVFLPALPLTSGGKIDRHALRRAAALAEAGPQNPPAGTGLTMTEQALAAIWQRTLGVPSVAGEDDFFAIGGDSLTAVQMMVEVESRFGLVLPVHLAFEAPTLTALARRIDRARTDDDDHQTGRGFVYPVVAAGRGAPMFFCGIDLSLARAGRWSVPCPLYAVAHWAAGAGFVRAKSLSALAAAHLQNIRRIQPRGPYRLGGYSLGGLVAFEMAHQLRAAGEVVEPLFLLDPTVPHHVAVPGFTLPPAPPREPLRLRIQRHHWPRLRRGPGPGLRGWAAWLGSMLPAHRIPGIAWLRYVAADHFLRHPTSTLRALFPRDTWRAFWFVAQRLVQGYTARPYDGQVLAVFCEQGPRGAAWPALLGRDCERHDLEVPHLALFDEPALSRWMAWLADRVGTAQPPLSQDLTAVANPRLPEG